MVWPLHKEKCGGAVGGWVSVPRVSKVADGHQTFLNHWTILGWPFGHRSALDALVIVASLLTNCNRDKRCLLERVTLVFTDKRKKKNQNERYFSSKDWIHSSQCTVKSPEKASTRHKPSVYTPSKSKEYAPWQRNITMTCDLSWEMCDPNLQKFAEELPKNRSKIRHGLQIP